MTVAGDMLREAGDLVDGPREVLHGDKSASFRAFARIWTAYLINAGLLNEDQALTSVDVCQLMSLLKKTRPLFGKVDRDHYVDDCGYAAIAGQLALEAEDDIPF